MTVGFIVPIFAGKMVFNAPIPSLITGIKMKIGTSLLRWMMVQICYYIYYFNNSILIKSIFFYVLIITQLLHEIAGTFIFISFMTFFSKISDPNIGGTYMTFLNTMSNLGTMWPSSLALWLLPKLTLNLGK
jgi:PAT family acetyl-CoA transporter-like MFS transporter 1